MGQRLIVTVNPMNQRLPNVYTTSHLYSINEGIKSRSFAHGAVDRLVYALSTNGPWTGGEVSWRTYVDHLDSDVKPASLPAKLWKDAADKFTYLINISLKEWVDVKAQENTGRKLYHPLPFLTFSHYEVDAVHPSFKGLYDKYLRHGEGRLLDEIGRWHRYGIYAMTQEEFALFMNEERKKRYINITDAVLFSRYVD